PPKDQITRPSMPISAGSRPTARAATSTMCFAAVSSSPGPSCGNRRRPPAQPHGDGALHGERRDARAGHAVEHAVVREAALGPEAPEEGDLLLLAPTAYTEVLAERLVLDSVPPRPDAETESTVREHVDLRGLLGEEHGLALRADDDA